MLPAFLTSTLSPLKTSAESVVTFDQLYLLTVEQLKKNDAASFNIQNVLHQSLLSAVETLGKILASDNHPYFKSIANPIEKEDEQKRIQEIFQRVGDQFPKTGTLLEPVNMLLEDHTQRNIQTIIGDLGIKKDLDELPEALRSSFESNLPLVMLAHFRKRLAFDNGLGMLFQLDITTAGFQAAMSELQAVSLLLRQRFGSDEPDEFITNLQNFLDRKLEKTASKIDQAKEEILQALLPNSDVFRTLADSQGQKNLERYLSLKTASRIFIDPILEETFTEKLETSGYLLIKGLPGTGKTITGLALAETFQSY